VLKKRGKIERGLIVFGSAGGSIADLARGMWRSGPAKRWILPLAIFLCVIGIRACRCGKRGGAGSVRLLDLLTDGRPAGSSCLPGLRRACWLLDGSVGDAAPRYPAPDGIRICALAATRAPTPCAAFTSTPPFPGYRPRDSLASLYARAERSKFARCWTRRFPVTPGFWKSGAALGR